jgi:hypothetical protein
MRDEKEGKEEKGRGEEGGRDASRMKVSESQLQQRMYFLCFIP